MLNDFRRQLGGARNKLLYGRRYRALAELARTIEAGWACDAAALLPPLPAPTSDGPEVHILCGDVHKIMGVWATWSLIRYLPGARLVVHSDGTLTSDTIGMWRRAIPGLRLVEKAESQEAMQTHLARFPNILDWSERYHFGRKIGGFYSILKSDKILEIDSDTLTFQQPNTVIETMRKPGACMAWNRDSSYCYAYAKPLIMEIAGDLIHDLPDRFNSGYLVSYRYKDDDWAMLDELVRRFAEDPRTDHLRYWMQQTLLALLAGSSKVDGGPLPHPYNVHAGMTQPNAVMRHFVGNPDIRPRFFTEGLAQVIRCGRAEGHLPLDFFLRDVPEI